MIQTLGRTLPSFVASEPNEKYCLVPPSHGQLMQQLREVVVRYLFVRPFAVTELDRLDLNDDRFDLVREINSVKRSGHERVAIRHQHDSFAAEYLAPGLDPIQFKDVTLRTMTAHGV